MKLIDKDKLVAEIEDKVNKYTKRGEESDAKRDGYGMYWGGVISCLNEIRSLLNTLEVKEVDLEKENRIGTLEREVKIDAGGYPYIDCDIEFYDYDKDIPLAKEGDKVKIIVIKEE